MTRDELLDEVEAVWLELEDFHHRCSAARLHNALAHDRLADIDYAQLWHDYPEVQSTLPADISQLR